MFGDLLRPATSSAAPLREDVLQGVRRSVDRGRAAARTSLDLSRTAARSSVDRSVDAARWSPLVASLGLSAAFVVFGASSALASVFARIVVTPVRNHAEDVQVLAVIDGDDGTQVILSADSETTAPGTYSLTFDGGASCARIGRITSFDPRDGTVQRVVEEVYSGDLAAATRGRLTGFVYPTPAEAGLDAEEVLVPVPGPLPHQRRHDPCRLARGPHRGAEW